jgi:DNA primase
MKGSLSRWCAGTSYTVGNIFRRLGQKEDPWEDMYSLGQSLDGITEKLDEFEGG